MADLPLAEMPAHLAEPFPDGAAVGSDPRADFSPQSIYFRLRDARSDARAEERRADNDPASPESGARHWKNVRDLAIQALSGVGKDTEIGAWLAESLVRSDGLDGLTAGAGILQALIERFWTDGLFPALDEDGPEARLAAIAGLSGAGSDGTLLQPLRKIVLLERDDGAPVALWQFEQARAFAGLGEAARQKMAAGSAISLDTLDALARGPGRASMQAVAEAGSRASTAWAALEAALGRVVGADAMPSMRRVHDLLAGLRRIAEPYATIAPMQAADATESNADTPSPASAQAAHADATSDRNAMFGEVMRVASAFRRNEPGSPFSYTLEEAVRRAKLTWPELLAEMVPEEAARTAMLSGLGIRAAAL